MLLFATMYNGVGEVEQIHKMVIVLKLAADNLLSAYVYACMRQL